MNETDGRLTEKDEQCSVLEQQVNCIKSATVICITTVVDCQYSMMSLYCLALHCLRATNRCIVFVQIEAWASNMF